MKRVFVNNDPVQEAAERQVRFVRGVSLLLSVFYGLALLGAIYLTTQAFFLPNILAVTILAIALGMSLAALSWTRSDQGATALRIAWWLPIISIVLFALLIPLLVEGSGLIVGLAAFLFIAWYQDHVFGRVFQVRVIVIALLMILAAFLLDYFGTADRIQVLSPLFQVGIVALELLVIVIYFARKVGDLPFRIKVVGAFISVSAVSVAIVASLSVILSSQSLSEAGNVALISAASATAHSVDTFFTVMRNRVFTEAQLPTIRAFLAQEQPSPAEVEEFSAAMDNLVLQSIVSPGRQTNYPDYVSRYLLANEQGVVVYDSTRTSLALNIREARYFQPAMMLDLPYASPVLFDSEGKAGLFFSARVKDDAKQVQGILVIEMDPVVLQKIILDNNNLVGIQSFPILVDDLTGLRMAQGTAPSKLFRVLTPLDLTRVTTQQREGFLPQGFLQDLSSDENELGSLLATNYGEVDNLEFSRGERSEGDAYFGAIATMETHPWRVVYLQTQQSILAPVQDLIVVIVVTAVIVALVAALLALVIGQALVGPISRLTNLAKSVADGDLQVRAPVGVRDEIGTLAESLNSMTDQLQVNIGSLENRVAERTSDLERRSQQLQAAAEIGRYVATIREQEELLRRSVRLISERFDYYHVGLFLVDTAGRYAVLSASNSEGGQRMLARGHRLAVGQQGIVGYVTSTGEPRIALDVGGDAVFFNNPDLPATRSEMALPLRSGGRILGALDVQSTQSQAFNQDDIATLQVLADLLSVSLDNARLFKETETALNSIRQAYGEVSQKAWVDRIDASAQVGTELGFVASEYGTTALGGDSKTPRRAEETRQGGFSLPIRVRDMVIGNVEVLRSEDDEGQGTPWSDDEMDLLNTLVDQIGVALEGARLYESSQLQAERERLVTAVSASIQESLDVDAVLRATVVELRRALDLQDVTIVLEADENSQEVQA